MRKLIVSMNISLDGLMAGPDDELDWHFESWTTDMAASLCRQLSRADTILLGKNTYSAMAAYWPNAVGGTGFSREDIAYASMMNSYSKVVFSRTISILPWDNTIAIKGYLRRAVKHLKSKPGKDIMIYGSGRLVSELLAMGIIDEYILWVHPVVLGGGRYLFAGSRRQTEMKLKEIKRFHSGVTMLNYCVSASHKTGRKQSLNFKPFI